MTAASAARLGFSDRERMQVSHQGDTVLFDPATFRDTATFEDPCRYPVGLAAVTVAGTLVVHGDRMTGERPGRFCRPGCSVAHRSRPPIASVGGGSAPAKSSWRISRPAASVAACNETATPRLYSGYRRALD